MKNIMMSILQVKKENVLKELISIMISIMTTWALYKEEHLERFGPKQIVYYIKS